MSYINDALRRAQKEKDNRYEALGHLIASDPAEAGRRPLWRPAVVIAVSLLLLASAALLFAFYGLPPQGGGPRLPDTPADPASVSAPPAMAVPSGAGPAAGASPPAARPAAAEPGGDAARTKAAPAPPGGKARPPEAGAAAGDAEPSFQKALIAQRAGDLRRAEALYEKALALDPAHVRALNNLGVIYMEQKRRDKAIAALGRAAVLKRDYVDPYYNLACLYAQAGEPGESLWYLKAALGIDGRVADWVRSDADLKEVAASPEFKKIMEGQKN